MTLSDVLYNMMQQNMAAGQPTELKIGTVTSTVPLEITVNTAAAPLVEAQLYLTEPVVEKKIPVLVHGHVTSGLAHSHTTSGLGHSHTLNDNATSSDLAGSYPSSEALGQDAFSSSGALEGIVCYENGKALPVEDGYIILNRGLAVGDRVLLLQVQHGQRFLVLSRVFGGEANGGE